MIVTLLAKQDILVAAEWYEIQTSWLVQSFLDQLRDVKDRIVKTPLIYQERMASIRVARLRRLPYAAYYRADDDLIVIIAVLDGGCDPAVWPARR